MGGPVKHPGASFAGLSTGSARAGLDPVFCEPSCLSQALEPEEGCECQVLEADQGGQNDREGCINGEQHMGEVTKSSTVSATVSAPCSTRRSPTLSMIHGITILKVGTMRYSIPGEQARPGLEVGLGNQRAPFLVASPTGRKVKPAKAPRRPVWALFDDDPDGKMWRYTKGDSPALVVPSICARDRVAHPWADPADHQKLHAAALAGQRGGVETCKGRL